MDIHRNDIVLLFGKFLEDKQESPRLKLVFNKTLKHEFMVEIKTRDNYLGRKSKLHLELLGFDRD